MSDENVTEETVESKETATEKAANDIAETTGVVVENVEVQEAKEEKNGNVISNPEKPVRKPVSNIKNNEDGVFNSKAADKSLKKLVETKDNKKESNKVALWSSKNVRWDGVGTLIKGYNIVGEEASKKWLTRNGIRTATPEEVAAYYDKK